MAFVARFVARWCRVETHRLTTLFQGKMVVVITHPIFKFSVPQIMPRNSGTNTTQENNFQAGRLRCCWKINFKKSVQHFWGGWPKYFQAFAGVALNIFKHSYCETQKNFQAKRVLTSLRIKLKKSVCLFVMPPLGGSPPLKRGSMPF